MQNKHGNEFASKISLYRQNKELTQLELARLVGTSQANISRIEHGGVVSSRTQDQILKVLGLHERGNSLSNTFLIYAKQIDGWKFASFYFPTTKGGDKIWINARRPKMVFLHCDAPGSDIKSNIVADNSVIAMEAVLAAIPNSYVTPESIYFSMDVAMKHTRLLLQSELSANILVAQKNSDNIRLLNAGMPEAYFFSQRARQITMMGKNRTQPIGNYNQQYPLEAETILFGKGDVLLMASDGLIENYERTLATRFNLQFEASAHALKGDAEGIATKFARNIEAALSSGKTLSDNISLLVISK